LRFRPKINDISKKLDAERLKYNNDCFNECKDTMGNKNNVEGKIHIFPPHPFKRSEYVNKELTFKPKINTKCKTKSQKNIYEKLYKSGKEVKQKVGDKVKEEDKKRKEEAKRCFTGNKSDIMVEKKKVARINEIFKALDGDSDQCISSDCIDIDSMYLL